MARAKTGHADKSLDILAVDHRYAWRYGWRWILSYVRQGKIQPAVRQCYWVLIRGHIGEACNFCGRPYMVWWAPNDLWERFAGDAGLCCPNCFDRRARRAGVILKWRPEAD